MLTIFVNPRGTKERAKKGAGKLGNWETSDVNLEAREKAKNLEVFCNLSQQWVGTEVQRSTLVYGDGLANESVVPCLEHLLEKSAMSP